MAAASTSCTSAGSATMPRPSTRPAHDDLGAAGIADRFAFLDTRTPRLHYALGD